MFEKLKEEIKGKTVYLLYEYVGTTLNGAGKYKINFMTLNDNNELIVSNHLMKYVNLKPNKKGQYIDKAQLRDYVQFYMKDIQVIRL